VSRLSHQICLAIPVYNEVPSISNAIDEFLKNPNVYNLLIIDDGSTDDTSKVLLALSKDRQFELLTHEINIGYGAACQTAAKWAYRAGYEWIIFADSDLTNPVNEIIDLALTLASTSADVYKANRFGKVYGMRKVKGFRRILSHLGSFIANTFVGKSISDPTNGFRAVRTASYAQFHLKSNDFSIILEEVTEYIRLGLKIENFESVLGVRSELQNPSSFRYSPILLFRYFRWTLKCFFFRVKSFLKLFLSPMP
jgi:glycosyltransferase involved in cell wall biosynthesis